MRLAVSAAALVGTLALAGCGSDGVMHNGRTALTYDGNRVSNAQLQTAAAQISKAVGATVNPSVVAGRLAIGPEIDHYAASKGQAPISDSQIRAQLPKATLSPTTLEALRTDALISTLANDAKLDDAGLKALSKKADVTVNPRYGTWVKGTGIAAASTPWIKATPTPSASATGNGHAAG